MLWFALTTCASVCLVLCTVSFQSTRPMTIVSFFLFNILKQSGQRFESHRRQRHVAQHRRIPTICAHPSGFVVSCFSNAASTAGEFIFFSRILASNLSWMPPPLVRRSFLSVCSYVFSFLFCIFIQSARCWVCAFGSAMRSDDWNSAMESTSVLGILFWWWVKSIVVVFR